ncbi:MAG: hypothetical protein LBR70_05370 [Lactobacillaceae bacterium]|jgi:hypothetical protein|nr:hypothetical protein [Lactobacillaceae bacterium]
MKRCCLLLVSLLAFTSLFQVKGINAQVFAEPVSNQQNTTDTNAAPSTSSQTNPGWSTATRPTTRTTVRRSSQNLPKERTPEQIEQERLDKIQDALEKELKIPQTERPTLDGVVRGHISMEPILEEPEDDKKEDRYIFIYLDNFSVRTTMSGKILCNVRFIVLSTLDRKINNVSVRLKWPELETPISFSDITPNVNTYVNYTLIGDGCYSLDKAPNIIVNRCRVRDFTQKECADKIRWLRKAAG